MVFETSRLFVRLLKQSDFPFFHELQSNHKVMLYAAGRAMSYDENKKDIEKLIKAYSEEENDFWVWAVNQKEQNHFVGTCAIVKNEEGENEIGYRFLEQFWGRGYGREIMEGLIKHAFETMKLSTLVAYTAKENIASVRILENSPFVFRKEYFNPEYKTTDRYYTLNKPNKSKL